MEKQQQGAVQALLAEYQKAIAALQQVIDNLDDATLTTVVDPTTPDPDCQSIQTILSHVVSSGYSYAVYIQNSRGIASTRPEKLFHTSSQEYQKNLDAVVQFTRDTFDTIYDNAIEEFESSRKIATAWGQSYDIEQLMEHAIVHVLRHRRQIEKFKHHIQQ